MVSKVGGNWWSFFNESYCGDKAVGDGGCAWKVRQVQKPINNYCYLCTLLHNKQNHTKKLHVTSINPNLIIPQKANAQAVLSKNFLPSVVKFACNLSSKDIKLA